ncbi:MAG: carboxylesterase family protein, partial [Sphingomonas sp.]|nr:carboxylesterase family protein [Sphingomonas sp.]
MKRLGLGVALGWALTMPVQAAGPVVSVDSGQIEGVGAGADGVQIFRGIPFAAPPVGALRWREPQPVASWTGVRAATAFAPRCMQ